MIFTMLTVIAGGIIYNKVPAGENVIRIFSFQTMSDTTGQRPENNHCNIPIAAFSANLTVFPQLKSLYPQNKLLRTPRFKKNVDRAGISLKFDYIERVINEVDL